MVFGYASSLGALEAGTSRDASSGTCSIDAAGDIVGVITSTVAGRNSSIPLAFVLTAAPSIGNIDNTQRMPPTADLIEGTDRRTTLLGTGG